MARRLTQILEAIGTIMLVDVRMNDGVNVPLGDRRHDAHRTRAFRRRCMIQCA